MEELLTQLRKENKIIRDEGDKLIQQRREYNVINARIQLDTDDIQQAYVIKIQQEQKYNEELNKNLEKCQKLLEEEEEQFKKASEDYMKLR
tara:strand:+ start:172 stop:444 length:273 start_codon:yes stop_codon:yes gene_type:complete